MIVWHGESVVEDICIGKLFYYEPDEFSVEEQTVEDTDAELERFTRARTEASKQIKKLWEETKKTAGPESAAIFEVHQTLLEDLEFVDEICAEIVNKKICAQYAVKLVGERKALMLQALPDPVWNERAGDIKDVAERIIRILCGGKEQKKSFLEPCILAARDLLPGEMMQFPSEQVMGYLLGNGSRQSHTAILAKGLGIPAIFKVGDKLGEKYDGCMTILDGRTGTVYVDPDEETQNRMQEKKRILQEKKEKLALLKGKENVTKDGKRIQIFANIGSLQEAKRALEEDAGGIGLVRTELFFLKGKEAPKEEEQFLTYKNILETMGDREVVIRTLDIGADKSPAYLPLEPEENPALGLRGIRLSLKYPDLLKTQLKALYRAAVYGNLKILYPMITSTTEIVEIREIEKKAREELDEERKIFEKEVPTGVMIETPAAALISEDLAKQVDFFSLGTNDLTQYTLAADRLNGEVAAFADPHHKAILRLIEWTVVTAHKEKIKVAICGDLATDFNMTEAFLRMGVDELSVPTEYILPLRQKIREIGGE